jgi:hypothetical protein
MYDAFGNIDCVVTSSCSGLYCPAPGNTALLDDYTYDYKNRMTGYIKYTSGTPTVTQSYTEEWDSWDNRAIEDGPRPGDYSPLLTPQPLQHPDLRGCARVDGKVAVEQGGETCRLEIPED